MAFVNPVTLPQDVLDRVERVLEYHQSTKHTAESVRLHPHRPDPANKPYEFGIFEMLPPLPLPSGLLDMTAHTLDLMENGLAALPGAHLAPPQDLKTLATWLHFADGIASRKRLVTDTVFTRTCASDGHAFPCELYVAAFAVDGLSPGLYHYSPREFALRKLRDGPETLARLTRGRPDLAFLKTVPLAILCSTIFCRSTWRFGKRGYRHAVHDAGYLVQNLATVATSLGVQTITRLILNDSATRELIGVPADVDFAQSEAVHAMVVWADRAHQPITLDPGRGRPGSPASPPSAGPPSAGHLRWATLPSAGLPSARLPSAGPSAGLMPRIERSVLASEVTPYVSIIATHQDCVAPGVAVREVRPPLTDLSPLPPNFPVFDPPVTVGEHDAGEALRKILLTRQPTPTFGARARPIGRDALLTINRLAFRGGTFFPLHPDGPHAALVRPFWVLHDVTGMDSGVWYYHPPTDAWSMLRHGSFRRELSVLALDQPAFGRSAATSVCVATLLNLMPVAGPDVYRLAHLESGFVTNRLALSSEALDLAWFESGNFYDDDLRQFLGLRTTGWEALSLIAIGPRLREGEKEA
jgi:SagB-type dehydrogenase family enzyme